MSQRKKIGEQFVEGRGGVEEWRSGGGVDVVLAFMPLFTSAPFLHSSSSASTWFLRAAMCAGVQPL